MLKWSPVQKGMGLFLGLIGGLFLLLGLPRFFPSASHRGYEPEQPIPFSHQKHAGDYRIPCLYCHSTAERSRHASVPGAGLCMNCHRVVKTESPWIQKIAQAARDNRPLEWIRIHELPDYVYFSHKRHLAQGLVCQDCHGPVESLSRLSQNQDLTMGWCMDCHRGKTTPERVHQKIYPQEAHPTGPVAPVECTTCHH